MAGSTLETRLRRLRLAPSTALIGGAVVLVEALLVLAYVAAGHVLQPNLFYPFVWMDVAVVAVATAPAPPAASRRRTLALAIAVGYLVVLGYFGGIWGTGTGAATMRVHWAVPPGYGPILTANGPLHLVFEPYKVVGYLALTYLVYGTILEAAGAALSGVVGLFSCVSCSWPIVATIASGVFGSSSIFATAAFGQALGLSTLVFVSAVVLLWWRPTV